MVEAKLQINDDFYVLILETRTVDQSFGHAFGIEKAYSLEVDSLTIVTKQDILGEDVPIEVGEDIKLIKVVEDILNDRLKGGVLNES